MRLTCKNVKNFQSGQRACGTQLTLQASESQRRRRLSILRGTKGGNSYVFIIYYLLQ